MFEVFWSLIQTNLQIEVCYYYLQKHLFSFMCSAYLVDMFPLLLTYTTYNGKFELSEFLHYKNNICSKSQGESPQSINSITYR